MRMGERARSTDPDRLSTAAGACKLVLIVDCFEALPAGINMVVERRYSRQHPTRTVRMAWRQRLCRRAFGETGTGENKKEEEASVLKCSKWTI